MRAWLNVIVLGLTKLPCKLIAPLVVPFLSDESRNSHPVFGVRDATDIGYWNIAIRNACHNLYTRPMPEFHTRSNTGDWSLEQRHGFQWRYRESVDGEYVSFRMTWGKPRDKGKREFYVGWTMNSQPYMRLTFAQLRVF